VTWLIYRICNWLIWRKRVRWEWTLRVKGWADRRLWPEEGWE